MSEKGLKRASEVLGADMQFDCDWTVEDAKQDFVIESFEEVSTGFGEAVILTCSRDEETHRWVTWSRVVISQLRLIDEYPIIARVDIRRGDKGYYQTLV